jgi:hypothetical protein
MGLVIRDGGSDGGLARTCSASLKLRPPTSMTPWLSAEIGKPVAVRPAIGVLSIGVALLLSEIPSYFSATGLRMEIAEVG